MKQLGVFALTALAGLSIVSCTTTKKAPPAEDSRVEIKLVGADLDPEYPQFALKNHVTGLAEILFEVDSSGDANSFTVKKEDPKGFKFASAAIAQIRSTKYKVTYSGNFKKQKVKRRFNFGDCRPTINSDSTLDTLTHSYKDRLGNSYSVKSKGGLGTVFTVYDSSGIQLEAGRFAGPDSIGFLYARDVSFYESVQFHKGFNFGVTGCEDRIDGKNNCIRGDKEIKELVADEMYELTRVYWRHFDKSDTASKALLIHLRLFPSGEIERMVLRNNSSGNARFATEALGLVGKWRFRGISGSLHQWVAIAIGGSSR